MAVLLEGDFVETEAKLKTLHHLLENQPLDTTGRWVSWKEDGSFMVPLPPDAHGNNYIPLKFSWLSQSQLYVLTYMLTGVTLVPSASEKRRAVRYFQEALRIIDSEISNNDSPTDAPLLTIKQAASRLDFFATAKCYIVFYLCLENFTRGEWTAQGLLSLVEAAKAVPNYEMNEVYSIILYAAGMYFQATGNLASALECFQLLMNVLPKSSELVLLASINSCMIYRGDIFYNPEKALILLRDIQPLIENSPNQSLKLAFSVLLSIDATSHTTTPATLSQISNLLGTARKLANTQLTTVIFYLGAASFPDQTQRSKMATAGFFNAKRSRDVLWCWITGLLLAQNMRAEGKDLSADEQEQTNAKIYQLVENLLNDSTVFV